MSTCSDIYDKFTIDESNNIFKLFQQLSLLGVGVGVDTTERSTEDWMNIYKKNKTVLIKYEVKYEEGENDIIKNICDILNINLGDDKKNNIDTLKKIANTIKVNNTDDKTKDAKIAEAIEKGLIYESHELSEKRQQIQQIQQLQQIQPTPVVRKLKDIYKKKNAEYFSFEEFVFNCIDVGKNNLAGFLKQFSSNFPYTNREKLYGIGMGLYGGFKLGGNVTNFSDSDFKKDFYEKKISFIKNRITDFFFNGGDILVCPEFDYDIGVLGNIIETQVGYGVGNKEARLASKHTFNTKNNFCRSIFHKESVVKIEDKTIKPFIKIVKTSKERAEGKKTPKEKENVDVNIIGNIILISVHLDSTTDITEESIIIKKEEIRSLLELVKEIKKIYNNNEIIIAGDFNFPYFIDRTELIDDKYYVKGFNGYSYDFPDNSVGYVSKYKITFWKDFQKVFGLECEGNVGVCLKERFTETLGNDQLWEGKGDKRAYNTDFVGKLLKDNSYIDTVINKKDDGKILEIARKMNIKKNEPEPEPEPELKFKLKEDHLTPGNRKPNTLETLHPYVNVFKAKYGKLEDKIDVKVSWLSDHALVYATIPLFETAAIAKGGGRTLRRNLMRKSKRNKKRKRTKNKKRNNKGRNSRKRT